MNKETIGGYYFNQGFTLMEEGKISKAVPLLEKAIAHHPLHSESYVLLGLCYYTLGEFSYSEQIWKQIDDERASRYRDVLSSKEFVQSCEVYNEAIHLCEENKWGQAKNLLLKIESIKSVSYYLLLGLCYHAGKQREEALNSWVKALVLDKENETALRYITEIEPKKSLWAKFVSFVR